MFYGVLCAVKPAFHDADTDIHRNNSRKSCMSDVSARILARMSVSWNAGFKSYGFWYHYVFLKQSENCHSECLHSLSAFALI